MYPRPMYGSLIYADTASQMVAGFEAAVERRAGDLRLADSGFNLEKVLGREPSAEAAAAVAAVAANDRGPGQVPGGGMAAAVVSPPAAAAAAPASGFKLAFKMKAPPAEPAPEVGGEDAFESFDI
jgi:hypothetical protein